MKFSVGIILACVIFAVTGCHSTKKLQSAVSKKDTAASAAPVKLMDSSSLHDHAAAILQQVQHHEIEFSTFSAKA